jgi:glycosyltransferase involved in cell wall biosynthesis
MDSVLLDDTSTSTASIDEDPNIRQMPTPSLTATQSVSVIIPALNEEASIGTLLLRLDRALTQASIPYEALIVDDHSTDNTLAIVEALAKTHQLPARALRKQGLPGKAFSLMEGFAQAQGDVLAMIDGDLQYPPEVLPEMVSHLAYADIVVADRRKSYSQVNHLRGALSHVFTDMIVSILFGLDIDMQSGLKVFHRRVYAGVQAPGRWSFDLHLVTQAVSRGAVVANVPIAFYERQGGKSKVAPLAVGVELLVTALRLKMHRKTLNVSKQQSND